MDTLNISDSEQMESSGQLCMICLVEPLSPCLTIQLECGHKFHHHCCKEILCRKWNGTRITFGFTLCPLCKTPMKHPSLNEELEPIRQLREVVQQKALTRLHYEGRQNSDPITKPGGMYFGDPEGYSLDLYAYYMCHKCQKPYFGGEVHCEVHREGDEPQKEELVCGMCSNVARAQVCTKHGADYFGYKCRYCCSIAVFFCFGTTHFCDACHNDHGRLGSMAKETLPKCPAGPKAKQLQGICPLNVQHPPTGEEFALGCAVCLNALTF